MAYVFDVSQTHGKELPKLAKRLTGDVPEYKILMAAFEKVSPYPIAFEAIERESCNGYCDYGRQRIAIREGLSQQQTIKTAIHELAHAVMHSGENDLDRQTKEVQAESVAFIVSDYLGVDTSDYSFGYIAGWSSGKELKELGESMDVIQKQAAKLIGDLEQQLELVKENIRNEPGKLPMGEMSKLIWDKFMEDEPALEQQTPAPLEDRPPTEPKQVYKSVLDEKIAMAKASLALQEMSREPRSRSYDYEMER